MPTAFTKQNLTLHSGYIHYVAEDGTRTFVARFKGNVAGRSAKPFMTFLRRHFTVEEYFAARETQAPLDIVETKGFVMSHIKSWLRRDGYPVTPEGYQQFLQNQIKLANARRDAANKPLTMAIG